MSPQSWNKYAYVRNNPLGLVDPSGQKAEVKIEKDGKKKTGTITIRASFVIYATAGDKVTQKDLEQQQAVLQAQIEATYSGSRKGDDGYTYTIKTDISVTIASSEKDAENSGADNLVEVGTSDVYDERSHQRAYAAAFHVEGESYDRLKVGIGGGNMDHIYAFQDYSHEFGHLLGSDQHNRRGVATSATAVASEVNSKDFGILFAPQIKKAESITVRQAPTRLRSEVRWIPNKG